MSWEPAGSCVFRCRRQDSRIGVQTRAVMTTTEKHRKSSAALILIDVINRFDFPDSDRILKNAMPIAAKLQRLKKRTRPAGIPTIYVNDNFGDWHSDSRKLVDYCLQSRMPGRDFVEKLRPDLESYFVLKPIHSAFFQTPLEILLHYLGSSSLILCGLATNSCILFTAHDAKMRNFGLYVPSDCCTARSRREHQQALSTY